MTTSVSTARSGWLFFVAWLAVGASFALALLAALSFGVFVAPFSIAATIFLATRRPPAATLLGLLSGLGVPLLYVALRNRSGPGTVCTATATGEACVEQSNPWVWLAAGVLLITAGLVAFLLVNRSRDRQPSM
jgi:hypothetical protein